MSDRGSELRERKEEKEDVTKEVVEELGEDLARRLVSLAKKQLEVNNAKRTGEKVYGLEDFLEEQAKFQADYPITVLMMPEGFVDLFGGEVSKILSKINNQGLRDEAEKLLTGAVSMVTFVDLLRRSGFPCGKKRIEGMRVSVECDVIGKCDLKLATKEGIFYVSLKTVAGNFDGEKMVQRVYGDGELECNGRKLGVDEQIKMNNWIEKVKGNRDSNNNRPIVPIVAFMPSNKLLAVDVVTGRLNEEVGGREIVEKWVEGFSSGMKSVGLAFPSVVE